MSTSSPPDRTLFFFSAGGSDAISAIENFSHRPLPTASLRSFSAVYRQLNDLEQDEVRVWGFRDTRSLRRAWARLREGDVGLGYAAGLFRVTSRLRLTVYSPELGRQLFADLLEQDPFPLLVIFDGTESAAISRRDVASTLGYREDFVPRRGLFIPSAERQTFLRHAYGGPGQFVSAVASGQASERLPPSAPMSSIGREPPRRRDDLESGAVSVEEFKGIPRAPTPRTFADPEGPRPHARLETPDAVTVGERFRVVVGLGDHEGSYYGGLFDPNPIVRDSLLDVQIVADGFVLEPGSNWRNVLRRTDETPYPFTRVGLRATAELTETGVGVVQALFAAGGRTIGLAARIMRVRRPGDEDPPLPPPQYSGGPIDIPDGPAPDLTVRINSSTTSDTRLLWTFTSPLDVDLPDAAIASSVGSRPDRFAREVLERIPEREGKDDLVLTVRGVGATIRGAMPAEFWRVLRSVQDAVGERRPTVLLLSEEPHVPWELALVDELKFPEDPPLLAAQTAIGRWILQPNSEQVSPPYSAEPRPFAVVVGRYSGMDELPGAVEEARELRARYEAVEIRARLRDLVACLGGTPASRILHFAIHGVYGPGTGRDGLYLEDREYLQPFAIKGAGPLDGVPLVFLNACEVGTGTEWLGGYAGTAEAFVSAGASAVIAPLWAINDELATAIALDFYERAFAGHAVAEILAEARRSFGNDATLATPLAYQFFGHPLLRFEPAT